MKMFRRNEDWMRQHGAHLRDPNRGKIIVVSQGDVFISGDESEAVRLAKEKHPDDEPYVELVTIQPGPFIITMEPTNPEEARRMELYERNSRWMDEHGGPLYEQHRGKYLAISEGEVFVADSRQEAERLALEKHPDDVPYLQRIFKEKAIRIYACQWSLETV
jgi:hypothetical protein